MLSYDRTNGIIGEIMGEKNQIGIVKEVDSRKGAELIVLRRPLLVSSAATRLVKLYLTATPRGKIHQKSARRKMR